MHYARRNFELVLEDPGSIPGTSTYFIFGITLITRYIATNAVATPKPPIKSAPMESTLIIKNKPTMMASTPSKNAKIFITASGSSFCGTNVKAKEIGPPRAVKEIMSVASKASDSKVVLNLNLQYFRPQPQSHH